MSTRKNRGDLAPVPSGPPSILGRFAGFGVLPILSAISPLLVLPAVAVAVEPAGWASALMGEALGTLAAIPIAWGWTSIGPAKVAGSAPEIRGRLYRESLIVRGLSLLVVAPILVTASAVLAADGYRLLTALMALQGALIAMSFTWFAVGKGDPKAIVLFDAVPRVLAVALAALTIALTGFSVLYPIAGIAVTLIGTTIYSWLTLRQEPAPWPSKGELWSVFRSTSAVAANDAALGAYSAVPVPLVNLTSPALSAASFASADKLIKLGQYIPLTIANAMQAWAAEGGPQQIVLRTKRALLTHGLVAVSGWIAVATLGPWVSSVLFDDAAAAPEVLWVLGASFACFTVRTAVTRHILFPLGMTKEVVRAGFLGALVGIPAMIAGQLVAGPLGAAVGFTATEVVMLAVLTPTAVSGFKQFRSRGK